VAERRGSSVFAALVLAVLVLAAAAFVFVPLFRCPWVHLVMVRDGGARFEEHLCGACGNRDKVSLWTKWTYTSLR